MREEDLQLLKNACRGKSKSNGGLNLSEFRKRLKNLYPDMPNVSDMKRKELEMYCRQKMEGKFVAAKKTLVKATTFKPLPKMYCQDYNISELEEDAARMGFDKVTSANKSEVCSKIGYKSQPAKMAESLGYKRQDIMTIIDKIDKKEELNENEKRIVQGWNRAHTGNKSRLNTLAAKYVSGERLTKDELDELDQELMNTYCRCLIHRQDNKFKFPICQKSVYKSRKLKPRTHGKFGRKCDDPFTIAQVRLEGL